MDPILQNTVFGVSFASILALVFTVYKCVNHKHCVSRCCGRRADMSLDISDTPMAGGPAQSPDTRPLLSAGAPPPVRIPIGAATGAPKNPAVQ